MSKENVEIVKRIFEGWSEGDFRPGREAFSDDVVFVADDPVLGRTPCHGLSEVTAYTREYLSSWSHVRHVAQEIIDCGDRVFVAERHIGVGKHSGVKSEEQHTPSGRSAIARLFDLSTFATAATL
jgi:ketosteroid isomerase-like protein